MKKFLIMAFCLCLISLFLINTSFAATEQAKRQAINDGLAYLASSASTSGSESYWYHSNNGTLAATASAALAFIEEGHVPGGGTMYDTLVTNACNYIFNRATSVQIGPEPAGHPEDYDNNGTGDGNGQGIYFNPANYNRSVYTTGVVAPVVYALGEALGENTAVGMGTVSTKTYKEVMRDVIDWFSWGQNDPATGVHRGGWRYHPDYGTSDNSTAQWGALPILYGNDWGLATPQFVKDELELYVNYIQNKSGDPSRYGGSGYDSPARLVNMSKTGGLLLELAAIGENSSDPRVQDALAYINSQWFQALGVKPPGEPNPADIGVWFGNEGQPYAMWAVYKALQTFGMLDINDNGTPAYLDDDFIIGLGVPNVPGGITIGQDWGTQTSLAGDWYSHYSEWLVSNQNPNGSWSGYSYWETPLTTGWYINILNAKGAPPVIPEPATMLLLLFGIGGIGIVRRKKRTK
jgi:hypothetical protein